MADSAQNTPPQTPHNPNSEPAPVRWGILGAASIAEAVAPAIASLPNARLEAIASRSMDRAQAWAKRHNVARAFGDYDEMLNSGAIDAVYIPLPNALHADWSIRALQAGIPVFCEKPIGLSAADAEPIRAAARHAGLPVAEGFMYRCHPVIDALVAHVRAGTIGTLRSVHARFTFLLDEDDSVVDNAELGGGALMDVGCYPVNAMRLICDAEPLAVSAMRTPAAGGGDVDRTLTATLAFPNGVLGLLHTSIESDEVHGIEVVGTLGRIVLHDPWVAIEHPATLHIYREREEVAVESHGPANAYALEIADFTEAIQQGRAPRWGLDDALANMKAIDAIALSASEGRRVTL